MPRPPGSRTPFADRCRAPPRARHPVAPEGLPSPRRSPEWTLTHLPVGEPGGSAGIARHGWGRGRPGNPPDHYAHPVFMGALLRQTVFDPGSADVLAQVSALREHGPYRRGGCSSTSSPPHSRPDAWCSFPVAMMEIGAVPRAPRSMGGEARRESVDALVCYPSSAASRVTRPAFLRWTRSREHRTRQFAMPPPSIATRRVSRTRANTRRTRLSQRRASERTRRIGPAIARVASRDALNWPRNAADQALLGRSIA